MNIKGLFFSLALLCLVVWPGEAQTATRSSIQGGWQGTLTVPGTKLKIVLNFSQNAGGALSGTLDLPEKEVNGVPLTELKYEDRILSFAVNFGAPSHYEGVVSRDATEIVGYFTQGPQPFLLSFAPVGGVKNGANASVPASSAKSQAPVEFPIPPFPLPLRSIADHQ